MIGFIPKRPAGSDPEARFMQWVWDLLTSLQPSSFSGSKTSSTTRGFYTIQSGDSSGDMTRGPFRLKSVQNDYVTCRSWDGTTEGATDVYIAKDYRLRCSLTTITELGTAYSLTYADNTTSDGINNKYRTKGGTEQQLVLPAWSVNEHIFALPAKTGVTAANGNKIFLLMVGGSKQWSKI